MKKKSNNIINGLAKIKEFNLVRLILLYNNI